MVADPSEQWTKFVPVFPVITRLLRGMGWDFPAILLWDYSRTIRDGRGFIQT